MFPKLEYLAWAIDRYGQIEFDLGTSGLANVPAEEVADPKLLLAGSADTRAPRK